MKRLTLHLALATLAIFALVACAPPPVLCDREAIEIDKFGQVVLPDCGEPGPMIHPHKAPPGVPGCEECGPGEPPKKPPQEPPYEPPYEPPHEPPTAEPEKRNNGLGNGDQRAPGRSLDRNRAENERGAPGHASGKAQNPN